MRIRQRRLTLLIKLLRFLLFVITNLRICVNTTLSNKLRLVYMRLFLRMINESFTHSGLKFGLPKSLNNQANYEYKEVVEALNSLQTNANLLNTLKNTVLTDGEKSKNLERTVKYLKRTGVEIEQLEKNLSVIHVSGTKGKGSTCAFCESILRSHGYKTGFFSSPHLISVRERIRIEGRPLTESKFIQHFWNVYDKLKASRGNENDMPPYFKFLTVMAFNVFLAEKVDVAIIEVGIGGEYDCTNILNKVPVVGITSLGLDHISLLGDTIEKIAWQKSGIMKNGTVAITSADQPLAALQVLKQRAKEKNCVFFEAPPLENYNWQGHSIDLGLEGRVQKLNASLALQLTNVWMHKRNAKENVSAIEEEIKEAAKGFVVSKPSYFGLKYCKWPGRNQTIERKTLWCTNTFFLDGAHTRESIQQCVEWFIRSSEAKSLKCYRTLMFNATGDRDDAYLMAPFLACNFHSVLFCPNQSTSNMSISSDQKNLNVTIDQQLNRCKNNINVWKMIEKKKGKNRAQHVAMFPSTSDAITFIENLHQEQHILITGSLHLIGAALSILDPELLLSYTSSYNQGKIS